MTTSPSGQCMMCRLFESQNVQKTCSLLPNVGSAEQRKIDLLSNILDSPFLLIHMLKCERSAHASTHHMI